MIMGSALPLLLLSSSSSERLLAEAVCVCVCVCVCVNIHWGAKINYKVQGLSGMMLSSLPKLCSLKTETSVCMYMYTTCVQIGQQVYQQWLMME